MTVFFWHGEGGCIAMLCFCRQYKIDGIKNTEGVTAKNVTVNHIQKSMWFITNKY